MKRAIKKCLMVALTLVTLIAFSGCNTAEGFGEDLETAGEELQEEANE